MGFGTLYVVATPLGNLEDITFRAVRVLKEAPVIACEDTRRTVKLLNRYEIRTPMVVFHEYNKARAGAGILRRLREGESVALVSDAGTPAISDPGYDLVRDAIAEGIPVEVVPGPSALPTACRASKSIVRAAVRFKPTSTAPPAPMARRKPSTRAGPPRSTDAAGRRTVRTPARTAGPRVPTTAMVPAAAGCRARWSPPSGRRPWNSPTRAPPTRACAGRAGRTSGRDRKIPPFLLRNPSS